MSYRRDLGDASDDAFNASVAQVKANQATASQQFDEQTKDVEKVAGTAIVVSVALYAGIGYLAYWLIFKRGKPS